MNNLKLENDTKKEIRLFYISTQGTKYEQKLQNEFFDLICPSIQEKVSIHIFLDVVLNNL